ncbi:MAG: SUMF1/EgtB/PvdO family nonheme iron enzyme [Moraxellaceae bacterium]|jgi:formylglycine-generating enzyme required for sulfatase activity|nr:SUMF1/EgtB/PvdO family nonheme iron enzyme [Moraxellaceae bacterium]
MKKALLAVAVLLALGIAAALLWRAPPAAPAAAVVPTPLPPPAPAPVLVTDEADKAAFFLARNEWLQARDEIRRRLPQPAFVLAGLAATEAEVAAVAEADVREPAAWQALTAKARELHSQYAALLPPLAPLLAARQQAEAVQKAWQQRAAADALATPDSLARKTAELRAAAGVAEQQGRFPEAVQQYLAIAALFRELDTAAGKFLPRREAAAQQRQRWAALGEPAGAAAAEWERAQAQAGQGNFAAAGAAFDKAATGFAQEYRAARIRQAMPAMVEVPAGSFRMGDPGGNGQRDELPVREVSVARFALAVDEITFDQYAAYAELTGRPLPADGGWGRGRRPVVNVSRDEAQQFASWLSEVSGQRFRLPTEAEWEYAARAGSTADYASGAKLDGRAAVCEGCSSWGNQAASPVGGRSANAFGLRDMHGNVWEWVAGCYAGYAPDTKEDCGQQVLRGGSWADLPPVLRASNRSPVKAGFRSSAAGFRVAKDL